MKTRDPPKGGFFNEQMTLDKMFILSRVIASVIYLSISVCELTPPFWIDNTAIAHQKGGVNLI